MYGGGIFVAVVVVVKAVAVLVVISHTVMAVAVYGKFINPVNSASNKSSIAGGGMTR